MSRKTMKKLFVTLATVLMVILTLTQMCYADGGIKPNQITGTAPKEVGEFKEVGNKVLGALQAVGTILAVILLAVLGIKYMMGSASDKSEYKKSMMPYVIGAAILFLAPTIANIVFTFLQPDK